MTARIIPLRKPAREPVRLMERYRAKTFRETTEMLRAEVEVKRLKELNDEYSQMLADALDLELNCAEMRRMMESW